MKSYAIAYEYRQLLGEAYREMGDEYTERGMYKKAIESYDKGKENYAEFGDEIGVILCSYEGFMENLQGDYTTSNTILKENLERYKKAHPIYLDALSTIAHNYVALEKIDSAYAYVNKMTFKKDDINNYSYQNIYNHIATKYFIEKNNIEKAIYYNNLLGKFRFTYQYTKSFFENKIAIAKLANDTKTQSAYIDSLKISTDKYILSLETKKVIDTEVLSTIENKVVIQQNTIFKNTLLFIFILITLVIIIVIIIKKYISHKKEQEKLIAKMQQELQSVLLKENIQGQGKKSENSNNSISDKIEHLTTKYNLTDRESAVLLHITKGFNNQQIANELFISINTIKYHIRNLYEKLDIKKRAEVNSKLIYND
jgi:DNA-binding CsgD family transcriptional regulator